MFGVGLNGITIYAVAVTGVAFYIMKNNITRGRVLRDRLGADWKKYVKPLFSK